MLGTDMQSCHNPDCTHFEVRQVRLTWSSTYYVFSSRNGRRKIILMPAWASKICIRRTETITSGASTNLEWRTNRTVLINLSVRISCKFPSPSKTPHTSVILWITQVATTDFADLSGVFQDHSTIDLKMTRNKQHLGSNWLCLADCNHKIKCQNISFSLYPVSTNYTNISSIFRSPDWIKRQDTDCDWEISCTPVM